MSTRPNSSFQKTVKIGITLVTILVIGGIATLKSEAIQQKWEEFLNGKSADSNRSSQPVKRPLFELVPEKQETFRLVHKDLASLGINIHTIGSEPPPNKLRLHGALSFDPNRFVRVHSRFPGEVRRVGKVAGTNRPLQFGDTVSVGDLIATIWSKDIGEKKSELVGALCRVQFDKIQLTRLRSVGEAIAKKEVTEAERLYQTDLVAVLTAERTLRSWNFSEADIESVRQEARDIIETIAKSKGLDNLGDKDHSAVQAIIADDGHWAELDINAAQAGVIAEKNFNVGDMVDTTNVLVRLSDIDRLQVIANVFEEDVPSLRDLPKEDRKWTLELKSESYDTPIQGHFDQIGIIVDPDMHTLPVMGYIDNQQRHLAIGQFITATIDIPGDPNQVVIPVGAVVEEGSKSIVFVETNSERQEYSRRQISVLSRGRTLVHAAMEPTKEQQSRGDRPLLPGERVLINSAVELDAELNDLISTSSKK